MSSLTNIIKNNKKNFLISCLIVVIFIYFLIINSNKFEGYSNYNLANSKNNSDDFLLLNESYPSTGKTQVNTNNYNDIWYKYPIFKVGSYMQITNNFKYYKNPDNGSCITADFCDVLYKDNHTKSNISIPLPPASKSTSESARVNYYNSTANLLI